MLCEGIHLDVDFFLHQETNKAFTSDCLASAKVD
jgi:hypothetical protein